MLDDILDYVEHIRERTVWQPIPDDARAHFRTVAPVAATDLAAVHDEFMRYILPFATGNTHPGFMGWLHGGGNVPGMQCLLYLRKRTLIVAFGISAKCQQRTQPIKQSAVSFLASANVTSLMNDKF